MPTDAAAPFAPPSSPTDRRGSRGTARGAGHLRAVPSAPPAPGATALQFSETVRQVVALARRQGLRPPVYRSPPRLGGVDRSIRRRPNGTVVVAVRRAGRPLAAVRADVIDGVVAANGLRGTRADQFRHAAWAQLEGRSAAGAGADARSGAARTGEGRTAAARGARVA